MNKPTVKPTQPITKQKQGRLANIASKQAKKNWNTLYNKKTLIWLGESFILNHLHFIQVKNCF